MNFFKEFNLMIKLLFVNVLAKININGSLFKSFFIEREIRQGCLLAFYLFFVLVEALNSIIAKEVELEAIKRIQLPMRHRQQIMGQYVDETSLILFSEKENVRHVTHILDIFCLDFGLIINWLKSSGY